jgi:putative methyltransferase (TIGR04325 family)
MPVAVIGNDRAEEPFVSPQSPTSGGINNSMGNPPMMNPVRMSPTRLSPTRLLRQLTPPILLPLGKAVMRLGRQSQFEYVTDRLPGDEPRGEGWDHDSIVAAQCRRWPDFLTAIRSTAPLGVSHEASQIGTDNPSAHNAILAFSYVLGRAAVGRSRPSVLDWGGGLGYYGAIATAVYPEIAFDYTVYDLPKICAAGRELQPDTRFVSDVDEALAQRYDLVFVSNALQYARDWQALLGRLAEAGVGWLFLSHVPLVEAAPAYVVAQRPSWVGYETEYLSWVFNRAELLSAAAAAGLVLEREFLMVGETYEIAGAPEQCDNGGFLFRIGRQ